MKETAETWGLIVGAIGLTLAFIWKTIRTVWRLGRMVDAFLGYDGQPSIPERMEAVETESKTTRDEVLALSTEVAETRSELVAMREELRQVSRIVSVQHPPAD